MWDDAGYVMASKYRRVIMEKLSKKNYLPSSLAKETKYRFSHISRALKELEIRRLVKCLNVNSKKGKIYMLTELGVEILKLIATVT